MENRAHQKSGRSRLQTKTKAKDQARVNVQPILYLASASPRRKALLKMLGIPFKAYTSNVDESIPNKAIAPQAYALLMAKKKAMACALWLMDKLQNQKHKHKHARQQQYYILGIDTIVAYQGKIFGKPKNSSDALKMLTTLQGKTHTVYSALCHLILDQGKISKTYRCIDKALVTFFPQPKSVLQAYLATTEPFDKAGSYAIQGKGAMLIKKISGDCHVVVGFPLAKWSMLAKEKNLSLPQLKFSS
ncbi:MAG: nucleoside triphosphate pyrophosphatase [Candidatus Woesearchaeota archaeon]